jgi:hypothetical protein
MSPSLSDDGSVLAFLSTDPLVPEDANAKTDVYVEDLGTGRPARASTLSGNQQIPDRSPRFLVEVLIQDLRSGRTLRAGTAYGGRDVGLSLDNRRVVFLDDVGRGRVHVTIRH